MVQIASKRRSRSSGPSGSMGPGCSQDRKSTRLNSSHMSISYAVFCLKKKTRRIVALDGPPVRVLLLSTFDLEEYLYEAVRAGVGGIPPKATPPDELAAGIGARARGHP